MADLSLASPKYSSPSLRRWFWILLLLNAAFIVWSRFYLKPLETSEIVKFEIAKELPVAEGILREWVLSGDNKLDKAIDAIYIDYLFIFLYVAGLTVACIYFSGLTGHQILKRTGRFIPFLVVAAGACDIIENIAMWYSMNGHLTVWNVTVTYDMAVTKFSIIILTLLFLVICVIFYLLRLLGTREKI
jgi:hypothetical protein